MQDDPKIKSHKNLFRIKDNNRIKYEDKII